MNDHSDGFGNVIPCVSIHFVHGAWDIDCSVQKLDTSLLENSVCDMLIKTYALGSKFLHYSGVCLSLMSLAECFIFKLSRKFQVAVPLRV